MQRRASAYLQILEALYTVERFTKNQKPNFYYCKAPENEMGYGFSLLVIHSLTSGFLLSRFKPSTEGHYCYTYTQHVIVSSNLCIKPVFYTYWIQKKHKKETEG